MWHVWHWSQIQSRTKIVESVGHRLCHAAKKSGTVQCLRMDFFGDSQATSSEKRQKRRRALPVFRTGSETSPLRAFELSSTTASPNAPKSRPGGSPSRRARRREAARRSGFPVRSAATAPVSVVGHRPKPRAPLPLLVRGFSEDRSIPPPLPPRRL
mmetsp:Transcript_9792/g.23909  ORF Transcript_9792/g.23909 Transcript_9792/m.23909 type:complete len:156 (+) Transcript_9792:83-550(+)